MPEEPEVETEKLRETIHEELEHQSGKLLRTVAIALGAVAALTRMRWVWMASLLVAVAGMLMLARPLLS